MLEIKDVHYISNITSNLLFTDLLEVQRFDFDLILKTDNKKQFKITDIKDQIFHATKTSSNIYKIVAVKAKSEQKFKDKSITTAVEEDDELKLSRSIYDTMKI